MGMVEWRRRLRQEAVASTAVNADSVSLVSAARDMTVGWKGNQILGGLLLLATRSSQATECSGRFAKLSV